MTIPSEDELAAMPEGPQLIKAEPKYTCTGCKHLKTKYWRFIGDDDESDSGIDADCALVGKGISGYWHNGNDAPKWCPITPRSERTVSVAEAARVLLDAMQDITARPLAEMSDAMLMDFHPAIGLRGICAFLRALAGDPT